MSGESNRVLRQRKNNPNYVDSSSISDLVDSENKTLIESDEQEYFSDSEITVDNSIIDLTQNCTLTLETSENNITEFKGVPKLESKLKMVSFKDISSMIKSIDSFGGPSKNIKLDLDKFCNGVELIWDNLGDDKNSQKLFLKMIKNKLCDNAYEIVRYTEFENWFALKKALQNKFVIRRSQGVVASELVNAKQTKNSEIRTFANNVQNLLNELNEICIEKQGLDSADIIKKINEDLALNAFENGIFNPFLKTIVKSFHFDNLEKSIEKAIDEEKCHVTVKSEDIICTFCKKKGHSQERCFKKQNISKNRKSESCVNSNEQNESSTISENKNKIFCTFCHKNNHVVQNCFKKNNRNFNNSNKISETHKVDINSDLINGIDCSNQASTLTHSIFNSLSTDNPKNLQMPEFASKREIRVDEI